MNTQYREVPLERFIYDPELPTRTLTDEERIALDAGGKPSNITYRCNDIPPVKYKVSKKEFYKLLKDMTVYECARVINVTCESLASRIRYIPRTGPRRWFYLKEEEFKALENHFEQDLKHMIKENEDG